MFVTLKQLDNLIDALCSKAGLYGLFSAPFFGKTSLVMYMAARLSRNGLKPLVISLECSKEQWFKRIDEMMMRYNSSNFSVFDVAGITTDEIRDIIICEKPSIVFIDYLQSLDDPRCDSIITLKNISKECSTPILITGQLPRSVGDYDGFDKRPELYDLCHTLAFSNDSFELIRKAISSFDVILFLHRHHDCDRNIGTAHRYNVSEVAELITKQSPWSLFSVDFELPERCVFDFKYIWGHSYPAP